MSSSWRDELTRVVCNFMLQRVATSEYARKIDLLIQQGQFHAQLGGPFIIADDAHEAAPEAEDIE